MVILFFIVIRKNLKTIFMIEHLLSLKLFEVRRYEKIYLNHLRLLDKLKTFLLKNKNI